jgi:hypothetical protein
MDNGDGTITDNQTGLQWEKKTEDGSIHDLDNMYTWNTEVHGTTPNGTVFTDFLGTLNDCGSIDGSASTGGFAGHCDWRLPTVTELRTIAECSGFPCIDPVFGPTRGSFHWSSTTRADDPDVAWLVNFFNGSLGNTNKFFPGLARAVRRRT